MHLRFSVGWRVKQIKASKNAQGCYRNDRSCDTNRKDFVDQRVNYPHDGTLKLVDLRKTHAIECRFSHLQSIRRMGNELIPEVFDLFSARPAYPAIQSTKNGFGNYILPRPLVWFLAG